MATFKGMPFMQRDFFRVHVREGPKYDSGKDSRKRERVEVLFLSLSPPTELNAIEASAEILRHYSVSHRSAFLWLDVETPAKDIEEPRAEACSQLQAWMERRQQQPPRSPRKILKRKRTSRYFIIVDETASSMVKDIMSHHNSSLRKNTVGLVFLQDNRTAMTSGKLGRRDTGTLHQKHDDPFGNILLRSENDTFQKRTWILSIDQYTSRTDFNHEGFIGSLKEPFQVAIHGLTDARKSQHPAQPIRATKSPHMQTKLYSDTVAPALKANTPPEWKEEKQFLRLRDHAEACLSNSDLKHALVAFQRCLKMDIPWPDARWEIAGSLALVQMGLGDYTKAEEELQNLLTKITSAGLDDKGRKTVDKIRGETAFRHALALSRLEKHNEALKCLSRIKISTGSEQLSILTEEALMLQGKVSRLQALSRAYLGFQDLQNLNHDLVEADRCCKELLDVPPTDGEKPGRANMLEYRWTQISTTLNKSRVVMLQGGYRNALQILQPVLRDAITTIGETDVLTLEATLLSCQLQILTGQVSQGRQSCERCADVIVDALGPEHNLALEAEYLLITADQAEGLLTLALDNSLALCRRVESRTDFGPKHPATLRYRSQLGGLHLQRGNYLEAESILESAWSHSADELSLKVHPNTLRIQSQLALARYHLGRLDMAERDVRTALRGQLNTYLRMKDGNLGLEHDCDNEFLKKMPYVLDDIRGIYIAPRSKLDDQMPHPDILISLLTLGKVLSRKQEPDLDLVLEIFWLVLVSAQEQLGPSHELSLAASLAMGEVFSGRARTESDDTQQQRKYYLKAASYYNFVVCPGSLIGGPDHLPDTWEGGHEVAEGSAIMQQLERHHPIVLHARREFLVVSILGCDDVMNDIMYVQRCKKELEFILTAQQSRLDWNHPHRLKTLFSLLALQVGLDEPREKVLQTQETLIERLRGEDVRGQRYLECLLMEENVAEVLYGRRDLRGRCRVVAEGIGIAVGEWEPNDRSLRDAAKKIKDRIEAMLSSLLET